MLPELTNPDTPITAIAGERFSFTLPSNPTTGFTWLLRYDPALLDLVASKYTRVPKGINVDKLIGGEGRITYAFAAQKPGAHTIEAICKRPWNDDVLTKKVFTINITEK